MLRRFAILLACCLSVAAIAAAYTKISPSSKDGKQILRLATKDGQKSAAHPIKLIPGVMRRSGDYAFVFLGMKFVSPKYQGDGSEMALLKKKGGRWTILESSVGSGGMEDLAADWAKKHHLPRKFVSDFE